VSRQS
jgi:hypothetical protein